MSKTYDINGFLAELKKNKANCHHPTNITARDEIRLVIDTDRNGDGILRILDSKGKPCYPDYNSYSGPLRSVLRCAAQIRRDAQFTISWANESGDGIQLAANRHIIYHLVECPCLYDGNMEALKYEPDRVWSLSVMLFNGSVVTPAPFLQNGGDIMPLSSLLSDAFARSKSKIVRIESVGENFTALRYFNDSFDESLLLKYLSVLYSTLDNVNVVMDGVQVIQDMQTIPAQPTIVIEKISEDHALYLKTMYSVHGFDPDFIRDFSLSRVAIRPSSDRIFIRPLEYRNIEDAADRIHSMAVRCCPGGKTQAKEIYRDGGDFIIPAHTAEPFLFSALPSLAAEFKIIGADKLKGYKLRATSPKLNLKLGSGIDFLEAEASIDVDGERFSLADFLHRYRKDNYIVLSDGDRAIIDENYIRKLERLFSNGKKGCKVSFFDLPEVSSMLEDIPKTGAIARSRKFYEGFNSLENKRLTLKNMNANLRPYQKTGVKWMEYLYDHSMGGCLADDMGLGKTIQTIALLTKVYPADNPGQHAPTLIVMPKSLIFNWQSELSRFAPQLDVYTHYGPLRDADRISGHQIVLTSYGMVRSDIESLKEINFHMVILDESQNIKNISAQMTQAVLLLKAEKRFALSGTPVENNLTELYSLFRFLNPAMFGTLQEFTGRYAAPIHKEGDTELLAELRRKIYPFMLRRTKGEVLDDLPERIDQKIYVEMEARHASFYEQRRRYFYESVRAGIAQNGISKSQFVILQALSELRRIASIPESMSDGSVESSKIPILLDSLEEAVANGHKVVVFFNFIAGIELVSERMDALGIGYATMTGSTQDRQAIVNRFQTDDSCRVLLMTLKTGGVGLNLTAADTVFIFEPWWNKAEEEQAVGRLHRIGQKCTVMTFSIITRGTIEEKICLLQDQKSQLVDALISSDGSLGKALTEDEIDYILQ